MVVGGGGEVGNHQEKPNQIKIMGYIHIEKLLSYITAEL